MGIGDYLGKGAKNYVFTKPDNRTVTENGLVGGHADEIQTERSTRYVPTLTMMIRYNADIDSGDKVTIDGVIYELVNGWSAKPPIGRGHKVFKMKEVIA